MEKYGSILRYLLTIAMSVIACCLQAAHSNYFKNIGVREGLSQLSVMSIHQDVLGRIWFGTLEGLSIYDGRQMITLKGGDDLFDRVIKGNYIQCIVENAAHDIFFMADGALIEYQFAQSRFRRIRESGVSSVSSIEGKIYVSVNDSILLWDEKERKLQYFLDTGDTVKYIHSVYKDSVGNWWIASNTGLYKWEDRQWHCIISDTNIWGIYESRSKELWISTNIGLYKINGEGEITHFAHDPTSPNSISCNQVRKVVEDWNGNFWIGTFKGLNKYSPKENKFEVYVEGFLPGSLRHSSIHSMMLDKQGNVWVGTYYGGASMFTPGKQPYSYYPVGMSEWGHLDFHMVGQMAEDSRYNLWICTDGGGLNFMERESGRFRSFNTACSPIRSDNLKSICYDAVTEKLYFALYNNGISSYNIQTGKFEDYTKKIENGYSKNVIKVGMWGEQLLYLSVSGVFRMDTRSGEIIPLLVEDGCLAFSISAKDILWVLRGYEIIRIDLRKENVTGRLNLKRSGLGDNIPLCIGESADGNIYVGTMGGGVVECDSLLKGCRRYTAKQNGLLDDYCYAIASSKCGKLILLSSKGVSFFNTQARKVEYNIMADNLPVAGFNDGNGLLVAGNGDIFAGSTDGLIIFSEEAVHTGNQNLSLFYSALFVNNVRVMPGDETGILNQLICYTKEISLKHNQNNIRFMFTDNNFGNRLSSPSYEYKLEGFDEKWITIDDMSQLSYTNLNPGHYTLRLREMDLYENKTVQEVQLAITIHAPFYNTPLAWIIYILSASVILYLILSARWRQIILRKTLEHEKRERERIEEMDNFKFKFFTNISHELRTPLTLIITQAELLLHNKGMASVFRNKINRLYQNACYMSNLINELLDFHKLEQKQMRLKVSRSNIVSFLNSIFSSFEERAVAQGIRYEFIAHSEEILCWFDSRQLRKVFFNLLSNAFKYTKDGGTVEVAVSEEKEDCVIRVIDSGSGISKEDIQRIFDRFYQASAERDIIGTGIGLALSKEIVNLHHGEMSVESMPGYGSIFTVRLKREKDCWCNDPKIELLSVRDEEEEKDKEGKQAENALYGDADRFILQEKREVEEFVQELRREQSDNTEYSILIVEDEPDLQVVLSEIFSGLYRVFKAANGKEGWMMVQKELPDIVLSDVMMPEMDGLEMCRKIKNTEKTKHIPVVLLTAAGSTEQQMDGLRTGADDYLTKPFDTKLLLLKVNAILRSHVVLKSMFEKGNTAGLDLSAKNEQDRQWLEQVEQIVQAHMDDYEFTVDRLADELKQSRSYVFKRIKALKGITPADFILGVRLKKGAVLLLGNPEALVEEIALQVGFGSGRHFSKVFKDYFNMSPSQYRKTYNTNC